MKRSSSYELFADLAGFKTKASSKHNEELTHFHPHDDILLFVVGDNMIW